MNLEKFSKAELLELAREREFLAQAVEAKDTEIAKLYEKLNSFKDEKAWAKVKDLENRLIEKDKQIKSLEDRVTGIDRSEQLEIELNTLRREMNNISTIFNRYINFTRGYLKTQQGSLDNTIELEGLLTSMIGQDMPRSGE
jgi:predicted RNase H-like nuclease (RuvC/YqgF family)